MDMLMETMSNLRTNRFKVQLFKNKEECLDYLKANVNGKVSVGGSITLEQIGLLTYLKESDKLNFIDRYNCDNVDEALLEAFTSDVYITSSNALTKSGMLYNVDGRGNRVAALTYGPKKVYVVVGKNKIVDNLEEAIDRVEKVAAIKNAQRLNRITPCTQTGICAHCNSDQTICSNYVVTRRSHIKERIEVLIVEEDLGY